MSDSLRPAFLKLFRTPAIAFHLVNAAFLVAVLHLGGAAVSPRIVLACALISVMISWGGDVALRLGGLTNTRASLPSAFTAGFVALTMPMLVLTMLGGLPPLSSFLITAALIAVLKLGETRIGLTSEAPAWADACVSALLVLSICLLARLPVGSASEMAASGKLPIWSDYFIHGVTIASLGGPFASGTELEMAGVTSGFYHYAPFILPAALLQVSGMTGLALSTSFMLPLGLLVGAYGCYTLASFLSDRPSGLLAVAVLICIPAFGLFIRSGWFNSYWLVFISPGTAYAIGVSALVCVAALTWVADPSWRRLILTAGLLASIIMVRAHFFLLVAPAVVALMVLGHWPSQRRQLVIAAATVLAVAVLGVCFSSRLSRLWIAYSHPYQYLDFVLQWCRWNGKPIFVPALPALAAPFMLLVVFAAVLGPYLLALPLLAWLWARRGRFGAADLLPPLVIATFLALMLLAPTAANGDFTEYKHRHFALVYAIAAIYSVRYAIGLVPLHQASQVKVNAVISALAIGIFTAAVGLTWGGNPARPDVRTLPWSAKFHDQEIIPGVMGAAGYLSKHGQRGEIFTTSFATAMSSEVNTLNIETIAMSGMPAYLTRAEVKSARSSCVNALVSQRVAALRGLAAAAAWPQARDLMRKEGIRWYLAGAGDLVPWDASGAYAVFMDSGLRIYDAGQTDDLSLIPPKC